MPPSLGGGLPRNDGAPSISEAVDKLLYLTDLYASNYESVGAQPYDPQTRPMVLWYG